MSDEDADIPQVISEDEEENRYMIKDTGYWQDGTTSENITSQSNSQPESSLGLSQKLKSASSTKSADQKVTNEFLSSISSDEKKSSQQISSDDDDEKESSRELSSSEILFKWFNKH